MARKPRVEFPGAFYHVISRGNRRETIFHDEEDRSRYLDRLERYRRRHGFTIYAYVLMSNHVHLLVQASLVPLSRLMQAVQFTYTRYYNRKYRKVGHLFQGRYKAILCDRDAYLLELVRYIHLNPGRMRRSMDPFAYAWSSHRDYVGRRGSVQVETGLVLGQFSRGIGAARRAYGRFMREGLTLGHQESYYEVTDQRFLGGEEFVERVDRQSGGGREIGRPLPHAPLDLLLSVIAEMHGVEPKEMVGRCRSDRLMAARSLFVYAAREWSDAKGAELCRLLGRGLSSLSALYARHQSKRDEACEKELADRLRARM